MNARQLWQSLPEAIHQRDALVLGVRQDAHITLQATTRALTDLGYIQMINGQYKSAGREFTLNELELLAVYVAAERELQRQDNALIAEIRL